MMPSSSLPLGTLVRFLAPRPFRNGDLNKGSLGIIVGTAEAGRDLLVAPLGTPDAPDFVNVQPSTVEVCCVDQQKLWDIMAKSIVELASQQPKPGRICLSVDHQKLVDIVAKSIGELASPHETRRERIYLIQSLNENAYSGRFLLFWKQGGGYTSSLDSAEHFTASRALAAAPYGKVAFWPLDQLRDRATPSVHQERVEFGPDRVRELTKSDLITIVDGAESASEPPEVDSEDRPTLHELTGLAGELPGNGVAE